MGQSSSDLRKRIAAARAYAGIKNDPEFAVRLGMSKSTLLRRLDQLGYVDAARRESFLRHVAAVCDDLPYEFFTLDFKDLPALMGGSGRADKLDDILDVVLEIRSRLPEPDPAEAIERELTDADRSGDKQSDSTASDDHARDDRV